MKKVASIEVAMRYSLLETCAYRIAANPSNNRLLDRNSRNGVSRKGTNHIASASANPNDTKTTVLDLIEIPPLV
jgi:hypothetical protein